MKPESVLRATRLIKTGEVIELGYVLNATMPLVGTRRFDVHTKRTLMNQVANRRASNEELVVTELGQVGTQLDVFPTRRSRTRSTTAPRSTTSRAGVVLPSSASRRSARSSRAAC
jgi:hypothetical protein